MCLSLAVVVSPAAAADPSYPRQAAVVADSFAAVGEGEVAVNRYGCAYTQDAWPLQLVRDGSVTFGPNLERYAACPGATLDDLKALVPLVVTEGLRTAYIQGGGNPYFNDAISACVSPLVNCGVIPGFAGGFKHRLWSELPREWEEFYAVFDNVVDPSTRPIIVGYGNPVPPRASGLSVHCPYLQQEEVLPINQFVNIINAVARDQAERRGYEFVDPNDFLATSNSVCGPPRLTAFNNLFLDPAQQWRSFHPNEMGHRYVMYQARTATLRP